MRHKIDLNTASREELEQVESIGSQRAVRIIEFRENRGGLGKLQDLKDVGGFDKERIREVARDATIRPGARPIDARRAV